VPKSTGDTRGFLLSLSTVTNGILWIVGLAMQIGGVVNQPIAYLLLSIAFCWSIGSIIYWWKNKWGNKRIRIWATLAIVAIVGVAVVLIATHPIHPRPQLEVNFDSSHILPSANEIDLYVVNDGQDTAYQYAPIVFAASANQIDLVFNRSSPPDLENHIAPNRGEYCAIVINQTIPVTGIWYIYYKPTYSDSLTGGRFYINDPPYLLWIDFDNPSGFYNLIDSVEIGKFKAAIKVSYPDADIK